MTRTDWAKCWRGAIGILACLLLASTVAAQQAVPVSHLAVDVVTIKSAPGKSIRGAIVGDPVNGKVVIAVSRDWLGHSAPELAKPSLAKESEAQKEIAAESTRRIQAELAALGQERRVTAFLKQELARIEQQVTNDKPESHQFLWLEFSGDAVTKIQRATPERQRIAMWSWSEKLANVETRDAKDLTRELKLRKIDVTTAAPDLSSRLPPRQQDDREWAARIAIVQYSLGTPLDFQGTGDVLVRSNVDQRAIDLAPLLSKVLTSQFDSFLKELNGGTIGKGTSEEPIDGLKLAIRESDAAGARGFRATSVELKLDGQQANVQSVFVARMPEGHWETIWSCRELQDASKPRADLEAQISGDPRITQALKTLSGLGLGGEDQVRRAIRFGAATMAAQKAADGKFAEFRERYLERLDSPPLTWSK